MAAVRDARSAVKVGFLTSSLGVFVRVWNGTAFVLEPLKVWNGTAFVNALAVKTWNGTAWV